MAISYLVGLSLVGQSVVALDCPKFDVPAGYCVPAFIKCPVPEVQATCMGVRFTNCASCDHDWCEAGSTEAFKSDTCHLVAGTCVPKSVQPPPPAQAQIQQPPPPASPYCAKPVSSVPGVLESSWQSLYTRGDHQVPCSAPGCLNGVKVKCTPPSPVVVFSGSCQCSKTPPVQATYVAPTPVVVAQPAAQPAYVAPTPVAQPVAQQPAYVAPTPVAQQPAYVAPTPVVQAAQPQKKAGSNIGGLFNIFKNAAPLIGGVVAAGVGTAAVSGLLSGRRSPAGGQRRPSYGRAQQRPSLFGGAQQRPSLFGGGQRRPSYGRAQQRPSLFGGAQRQPSLFGGGRRGGGCIPSRCPTGRCDGPGRNSCC